ncbi:MAG: HAD family hydrolase [Oscillospiraceae bacterium]|nr:HAD family hydrolase [Oscillospiraceae bacterium]
MKKALFWDFDGTLVHSGSMWSINLHGVLKAKGYNVDFEALRMHLRTGYTWHTPEKAYPESVGEKWWGNLFEHLDAFYHENGVSKTDMAEINRDFRNSILHKSSYTLYDDAIETLRLCKEKGYANYIVSNNYPELPRVITEIGLSGYISACIVSGAIGYEKPRPEIFQFALKRAGDPDSAYMIGDNPEADIKGGRAAGLKTILVHNDGISAIADYTCARLSEIPDVLKG